MNRSDRPLVSIVIPSYNQGAYIRDAIDSCLAQDYRPLEVLIIDGASTDSTLDVLHQYDHVPEVTWISEKDKGVAYAVNNGLASAKGELAGIQCSDDAYLPGAVSQAVDQLLKSPEIGLVYSDWIYVNAAGKEPRPFQTGPYSLENFLSGETIIPQHAAFFRLALAREVGGWNPDYFAADTEMWLRMLFKTEARKVDAYWAIRRIQPAQRNTQAAKIVESYKRMMDMSPDLAMAPRRMRKAAKCGRFLIAAGYNPSGSGFVRKWNTWRAFWAFPKIARTPKVAAALFPGYWQFQRWHGKLSRGVAKLKCRAGQRA